MNQQERQQLESLAKSNLRYVVHCKGCQHFYGYKPDLLVNKPALGYLIEVGIHCPHCQLFHRLYWMNQALIEMRQEMGESPNRKQKRVFGHQFEKLQRKMRLKNAVRPG